MSELVKYKYVFRGIIISAVTTFVAFLITSIISIFFESFVLPGFFFFADIQFSIGTVVGVVYFLQNRRKDQSILLYGVIVGIVGGIGAAFFIAIYQWIIVNFYYFVGSLIAGLISGVFVGLLIGVIICIIYMYKEAKGESPQQAEEEDFFKDLLED